MKYLLYIVLLFAFAIPSVGQSLCEMTAAGMKDIHGLRLGQSRSEVERIYSVTPEAVIYKGPEQDIHQIEGIWFGFHQNSLTRVEIDYYRVNDWKNINEFAAAMEANYGLPADAWVFIDRTEAVMKCSGFTIALSSVRNTLTLMDAFIGNSPARQGPHPGRNRIFRK